MSFSELGKKRWTSPEEGRLAINVDAAWKKGQSFAAMVVRDFWGRAKLVAAIEIHVRNVEAAELKALVWAMAYAVGKDWHRVEWRSDAKSVVKQALSLSEPLGWETRNNYLTLRKYLQNPDWSLAWVTRICSS